MPKGFWIGQKETSWADYRFFIRSIGKTPGLKIESRKVESGDGYTAFRSRARSHPPE